MNKRKRKKMILKSGNKHIKLFTTKDFRRLNIRLCAKGLCITNQRWWQAEINKKYAEVRMRFADTSHIDWHSNWV